MISPTGVPHSTSALRANSTGSQRMDCEAWWQPHPAAALATVPFLCLYSSSHFHLLTFKDMEFALKSVFLRSKKKKKKSNKPHYSTACCRGGPHSISYQMPAITSLGNSIQCSSAWIPSIMDGVPASWRQPGPALQTFGVWGVSQQLKVSVFLSPSIPLEWKLPSSF